jgi:tetratricopeptide (TPR) repeat protein
MEARLLMAEHQHAEALEILRRFEKRGEAQPGLYLALGRSCASLKQWEEAEAAYKQALKLDPDNAHANTGLAQIALAQGRNFEAAGFALNAVGLLYHNPHTHFLLGMAMLRLGQIERAAEAFQICVAQNPAHLGAHRRLALIYRHRLKDLAKADAHAEVVRQGTELLRERQQAAAETALPSFNIEVPETTTPPASEIFDPTTLISARADAPFATIVSGLPRSGTSLMMQMLAVGGLPPLHDGHRPADADNPRGYYEFASAKNIRADGSWMPHATGRALKLVAQLLPFLPLEGDFRIILMERSLEEVLASQKVMLDRNSQAGAALDPDALESVYERQLAHVQEVLDRRGFPVLRIAHAECLESPQAVATRVADFLQLPLDLAAMSTVVDPALYRNRRESLDHPKQEPTIAAG